MKDKDLIAKHQYISSATSEELHTTTIYELDTRDPIIMADSTMENGDVQKTGGQVQVNFVTEEQDFQLDESKRILLVPTGTSSQSRF